MENPDQSGTDHSAADPTEQMALATARIECRFQDGGTGTGTGFFVNFVTRKSGRQFPMLVTNKHVIDGATDGSIVLHTKDQLSGGADFRKHCQLNIPNFRDQWIYHPDPDVDLAVAPIGHWLNSIVAQGIQPFGIFLLAENMASGDYWLGLRAIEDIIMVGYPIGLWDSENNMPLVRRGITASHPRLNFEGRREFLIDAACFPGSSGSPVFQFNSGAYLIGRDVKFGMRLKLLGVLYAGPVQGISGEVKVVTVPTKTSISVESQIPINLGFVIKADRIIEFLEEIERRFDP